jgi:hypothetical protein
MFSSQHKSFVLTDRLAISDHVAIWFGLGAVMARGSALLPIIVAGEQQSGGG